MGTNQSALHERTAHDDNVARLSSSLQLLTTRDAAQLLALSTRTLEKWRVEGGGPPFVVMSPKCVRYRLSDLRTFQEERLAENTTAARQR